jgi:signal peptidase I
MRHPVLRKAWKIWRHTIQPLAILVLILTSFRSAVADWNDVPSGSMRPSIIEGDRIFVNKLAYGLKVPFTTYHLFRWETPQRGDIVIFNSPRDGTRLVKRVVGLPGDVVQMIDNRLYIDGQPIRYEPAADSHGALTEVLGETRHAVIARPELPAMRNFGPVRVPAGEYFMLGDNRDQSADSRFIGTVKLDQIVGRSTAVALSVDYDHYFKPRWERFFMPLD